MEERETEGSGTTLPKTSHPLGPRPWGLGEESDPDPILTSQA